MTSAGQPLNCKWYVVSNIQSFNSPALLHKLKLKQTKINAKAMVVKSVIKSSDIITNPKLLSRAGVARNQAEMYSCDYACLLKEAYKTLREDERLVETTSGDMERENWLMGIEANLKEMLMLRDSPEKDQNKTKEHHSQTHQNK